MAVPLNGTRGISPKPQVNSNKFNNVGGGSGSRSGFAGVSAVNNSSSPHFARNDGGRFSLRMPKSRTPPAQVNMKHNTIFQFNLSTSNIAY